MTVPYVQHEAVIEDYAASEKEVRRLRRVITNLEKEQSVEPGTEEGRQVQELLDLWWVEVMGSDPRVIHDLSSTRAAKVRAALRRRKKAGGFDICRRAVLGARYDDWAMGRIRKSGGKAFNDIAEHILNTDGDIEKFAKLYDREQAKAQLGQMPKPSRPRLDAPTDRVLGALEQWQASATPDCWYARCPAHDDSDPSLSIRRVAAPDGELVLLNCFAGCDTEDVLAALGLGMADLFETATEREHFAGRERNRGPIPLHLQRAMQQLLERRAA